MRTIDMAVDPQGNATPLKGTEIGKPGRVYEPIFPEDLHQVYFDWDCGPVKHKIGDTIHVHKPQRFNVK